MKLNGTDVCRYFPDSLFLNLPKSLINAAHSEKANLFYLIFSCVPVIAQKYCAVVVPVTYHAANSLIDSPARLLPVPLGTLDELKHGK